MGFSLLCVQPCLRLPFRQFVPFLSFQASLILSGYFLSLIDSKRCLSNDFCCQRAWCFKKNPKQNYVFPFRSTCSSSEYKPVLLKARKTILIFRATEQEKPTLRCKDSLNHAFAVTGSICLCSSCFCFNWNRGKKD